jgi:hypothetical protein
MPPVPPISSSRGTIPFRQSAFLRHSVAVIEVGGVSITAACPESEFQFGSFGQCDEVLVGDVRDFVDLDREDVDRSGCE